MKIFLSAVTRQFKECRDALASDLRAIGAEVRVQEDFTIYAGGTLLEKIERYIDGELDLIDTAAIFPENPPQRLHGCA